jgi:hypothetical protein
MAKQEPLVNKKCASRIHYGESFLDISLFTVSVSVCHCNDTKLMSIYRIEQGLAGIEYIR